MMLLNNGLSGPPWGVPSSLASNKPLFITPLRRYLCIRLTTLPSFIIVLGYFYPFHRVQTVRTVHQGTNEFILIGQEPCEQLLTRHLVDTTTALVSHHSLVGSVEICRTKDLLEKVFLVEWYFHDVVFTHPHKGLHSPILFGFRPISFGQPLTWDNVFCILSFMRYVSITIV